MTEDEKLNQMRSIPGFVELPKGWADRVKIGSTLIKATGTIGGEIKRSEFTVSNVGKKMITLRSAEGITTMVARKGWSLGSYNFFYWIELILLGGSDWVEPRAMEPELELELEPALKDVLIEAIELLSDEIDAFTLDPQSGISVQQLLAQVINGRVNNRLGTGIDGGDLQDYFEECVEDNLPDGHE